MLEKIIDFSVKNKLIIILFTLSVTAFGLYAVLNIPVGAVPDITNNQVQVITTSGNLSTQEIEQFITAPVEMEMANLPGVIEIRSISKFGISVVTIVFEENLGTYLPRQLIAEKIKSAAANIPEAYGTPEMGPITTGLGEIYQYIVDVKPGYEGDFTATDLRTIQDWIIKRRLSGIQGVVEINSWGGYLKQYEVAINPAILQSFGINLMEVFDALENNNSITGGSYIEKTNQSYFIRGDGQVRSIEDIENIVVKTNAATPILVKDIATVQFGYANRFGAITANGKGETVLGQIMMLKNANSNVVINEVKKRVKDIQENLPEGVFINPILERSELISKTSFTVVENLILGAIIVLLTVILILGNVRSALVIASMIPLALLFTISLMYIFGIDANLMSLGALDFGIIIDGAVIIVEFIAIRMKVQKEAIFESKGDERQTIMDKVSFEGASKMMKSAVFGQVIILIVFIPILSLSGVEGKMFRPMALSFSFAIIGAMILGLTWLPVASALFLKPNRIQKRNLSDWLMDFAYKSYYPSIKWSCGHKRIVLGAAVVSLIITGILFSRIGGEFVPTLDEGDFVIQPVLKTGTSLTKTVEMTTKMESILIKNFPDEVDQIVSRIGAAEVPTDPMSMEEIDMIIKLNPKHTWTLAKNKEELAEKFKEALSIIPGVEYEFTQPIEMRFNELITGVRSDIAIKIFGEDLEYINKKAIEVKNLIADVEGASDIILEKTSGLPQIKVDYNRSKIAYYGIDINTLNTFLSAAFGGAIIGVVFEGEKRFDMVMRFDSQNRTDIDDIRKLQVPVSSGAQIPFSEIADIQYTEGPAKISRDNTHRRVVVSVNVRNRDLQSVIEDIQHKIDGNIKLSPGNYIEYGGQFENLQNATNRLMLAVPIALLLIFIFLHFAFKSMKDAVMIFTAIPLATVGGVFLLWVRGMPFSVSAGIGFIALFGIAVLNGIVLIEHLKELQHQGMTCIRDLILTGTKNRLRPVMLTAGAAAMGFLPMAISTGAGAEVQRPLATVVIGGLITSTLLTMIALPLLFEIFYNVKGIKFFPLRFIRSKPMVVLLFILLPGISLLGQNNEIKLNDAIEIALQNNREIAAYKLKVEESKVLMKTAFAPEKTVFSYGTDQNNVAENGYPLKVWGVEQSFSFPTLYSAEKATKQIEVAIAEAKLNLQKNELKKNVSASFYSYQILLHKKDLYQTLDSLYTELLVNSEKREEKGDARRLEVLTIRAKKNQTAIQLSALNTDIESAFKKLRMWMNSPSDFYISKTLEQLPEINSIPDSLPIFDLLKWENEYHQSLIKIDKNKMLPDFSINYFLGSNRFANSEYYHGFQVGLAVPLFYGSDKSKLRAARINSESQSFLAENERALIVNRLDELLSEQLKYKALIENYNVSGKLLYDEIMYAALKSYQVGEINFYNFVNSYETAVQIQFEHLDSMLKYYTNASEILNFSY
ncbi:MAG: CusA/CzcA family heavy metal efflux RND transporter [Bacteroidales bacterium]|nr:CusA/CzcA family heavy metal efflux RND transporter [Bacteroidales bacterium]MCF8458535.1 CusA/CzcA family heavy metal efflux RND transporter [Bacteroidales bacterium]